MHSNNYKQHTTLFETVPTCLPRHYRVKLEPLDPPALRDQLAAPVLMVQMERMVSMVLPELQEITDKLVHSAPLETQDPP